MPTKPTSDFEFARLFDPERVALVGASANRTKLSGRVYPYLQKHGFDGDRKSVV